MYEEKESLRHVKPKRPEPGRVAPWGDAVGPPLSIRQFSVFLIILFAFNCDVGIPKEHIGLRIKRLRAFRGMTQDGLAQALGKSRSLISFLERTGSVNPYTLNEICSILRTSPEELEPGQGEWREEDLPDKPLLAAKDELIEQLREENRFLRETIHQQWSLFRHREKGE